MAERRVRVTGVFSTPTGDLSLFRLLAQDPRLDLRVLFAHPDRSGRGGAGEAEFPHTVLGGRTLRTNRQTAVDQVWNRALAARLREGRPDVLFVGGYGTATTARALAWATRRRVPWVLYSESWGTGRGSPARRAVKRVGLRRLLARGAGFVTYGRRGEEYLRHFGAGAPIVTIGSNRDLASIAAAADEARERSGPREDRVALFVGRMVEAKGVDLLLAAFARAAPPGWRLRLAGDGPLRAEAERAAADRPIEVLGPVPFTRIAGELAAADLLVLPSRREPWGQVVPEAMAAGIPVLSSEAVGAAEHFVEPGVTGWVVPSGDRAALEAALREAAGAPLEAMGRAARERALRDDVRVAAGAAADLLVRAASWR